MTDVTRPIIGRLIIDTAANMPPATPKNKDITFIASDTGAIMTCDGTTWSPVGGGTLPGLTADGGTPPGVNLAGGMYQAVAIPNPTDPPTCTLVTADPGNGKPVVPAGTYYIGFAWQDESGFATAVSSSAIITADGVSAVEITLPPAPETAAYYCIGSDNGSGTPYPPAIINGTGGASVPVVPWYLQVYDDATFLSLQRSWQRQVQGINGTGPRSTFASIAAGGVAAGDLAATSRFRSDGAKIRTDGMGTMTMQGAVIHGQLASGNVQTGSVGSANGKYLTLYNEDGTVAGKLPLYA